MSEQITEHRFQHEWPNSDAPMMDVRQVTWLRITPISDFKVTVMEGFVWIDGVLKYVSVAVPFQLEVYIPAIDGFARMVWFVIDNTGTVVLVPGQQVLRTELNPSVEPVFDGTVKYILGAVRLYSGQASIWEGIDGTDVLDLRLSMKESGSTTGGHEIDQNLIPLATRSKINFTGSGVAVTDDPTNDATTVTILQSEVGSSDWSDITNKPVEFDPSPHIHPGTDITSQVSDTDTVDGLHAAAFALAANNTGVNTGDQVIPTTLSPTTHASTHKNGGADEIATATPAANAIPKADANGKLDGWVTSSSQAQTYAEDLSSQVGASTTVFSTTFLFIPNSITVFRDGIAQMRTLDFTEGAAHNSITLLTAAATGDKIFVVYQKSGNLLGTNAATLNGYAQGHASGNIPLNDGTLNTNLNADLHDGYHVAHSSGAVPISDGTANINLNADLLDGYHATHSSGGIPVSDTTINTNLNADMLDGSHASSFAAAAHNHTAAQLLLKAAKKTNSVAISHTTTNIWQLVTFDTLRFDTGSLNGTNRLIIPETGYYLVGFALEFAFNATASRYAAVSKNSGGVFNASTVALAKAGGVAPTTSGHTGEMASDALCYLFAGDYLELWAFQNSGGALNITKSNEISPELWSIRMF